MKKVIAFVMEVLGYTHIQICDENSQKTLAWKWAKVRHIDGLDWDDFECDIVCPEGCFLYAKMLGYGMSIGGKQ